METNLPKNKNIANGNNFRQRIAAISLDIFIFLLICFGLYVLMAVFIRFWLTTGNLTTVDTGNNTWLQLTDELCLLCAVFLSAWGILHRRGIPLRRLGLAFHWKGARAGLLLAILLYAVGIVLLLLSDDMHVESLQWHSTILFPSLLFYLLVAITEELLVRGFILGRMLDGRMNRFVALFLTSLFFALMHFFNPDFSWLSFLNILLAGILLGTPFIYTRNLTFPIFFHWFWNWIQGPVLGFNISGNETIESLFVLSFPQTNLLNGGTFGFEGSLFCTLLLVLGTGIILFYYERKKQEEPKRILTRSNRA